MSGQLTIGPSTLADIEKLTGSGKGAVSVEHVWLADGSQTVATAVVSVILGGIILVAIVSKVAENLSALARAKPSDLGFPLMIASVMFLVLWLVLAVFMTSGTQAAAVAGGIVGVLFLGMLLFG